MFSARYNLQTSTLRLPSTQALSYLAHKYDQKEEYVRNNYAKLNIFFEALNYETIEQKVAYEIPGLLGDIGGQMGLFIGASILTILELFNYLYEVIKDKTWGKKLRRARQEALEHSRKLEQQEETELNNSWKTSTKLSRTHPPQSGTISAEQGLSQVSYNNRLSPLREINCSAEGFAKEGYSAWWPHPPSRPSDSCAVFNETADAKMQQSEEVNAISQPFCNTVSGSRETGISFSDLQQAQDIDWFHNEHKGLFSPSHPHQVKFHCSTDNIFDQSPSENSVRYLSLKHRQRTTPPTPTTFFPAFSTSAPVSSSVLYADSVSVETDIH